MLISRDLVVHNNLTKPIEVSSLELLSHRDVANFRVDISRPPEVAFLSLEPHRNTLIGSVTFNASMDCAEVLAPTSGSEGAPGGVCYAGFELNNIKGMKNCTLTSLSALETILALLDYCISRFFI